MLCLSGMTKPNLRRKVWCCAIGAICATTSAVAVAQPTPGSRASAAAAQGSKSVPASDCARAARLGKPCVLTMEDATITGDRPAGDGARLAVLGFGKHASLIRLRYDFLNEIVRAADRL